MKFKILAAVVLLALLGACSKVPAGYVGVLVHLLGTDKGVDSEVKPVGRYWVGINEELFLFPTFLQNREWTAEGGSNKADQSFTFQTRDGMKASADIGVSFRLEQDKIAKIFQTYRKGIDEITDIYLRNMVRDALVKEVSNKPIEYVYGEGKAELIRSVEVDVQKQLEGTGIIVEKLYWIGDIRVPEIVTTAINAKIEATQKAQQRENEVQQTIAEANKERERAKGEADATLERAKAQATANKLLSESLTDSLVQYQAIEKWDGQLPSTMLPGASVPMIGLK